MVEPRIDVARLYTPDSCGKEGVVLSGRSGVSSAVTTLNYNFVICLSEVWILQKHSGFMLSFSDAKALARQAKQASDDQQNNKNNK